MTINALSVLMVWHKQKYHIRDCNFCLTNVQGFSAKSKHGIQHPNLNLAARPVPHDGFPTPKPPSEWTTDNEAKESFSDNRHGATTSIAHKDPDFFPLTSTSPHFITQELNDLVRDLNLSQTQKKLLVSQLQGSNLLQKGVKVT